MTFPNPFHKKQHITPIEQKSDPIWVKVDDKTLAAMAQIQQQSMANAVKVLSSVTFDAEQLGFSGLKSATAISLSTADWKSGGDTTLGGVIFDESVGKFKMISGFLERCWQKAASRIMSSRWIKRSKEVLGIGIEVLLYFAKKAILSTEVLGSLVPFYDTVKNGIGAAYKVWQTLGRKQDLDAMNDAQVEIAEGLPQVAMDAFRSYVKTSMRESGATAAYRLGKSVGSALVTVFTAGAGATVNFALTVIETICSFMKTLARAFLFDRAGLKLKEFHDKAIVPSDTEFRQILSTSPYMSCVFFGIGKKIGWFQLCSLMTPKSKLMNSDMLASAQSSVNDVIETAIRYYNQESFALTFRDKTQKATMGRYFNDLLPNG